MTILWAVSLCGLAALMVAIAGQWARGAAAEAQWRREERQRADVTDALASVEERDIRAPVRAQERLAPAPLAVTHGRAGRQRAAQPGAGRARFAEMRRSRGVG